MLLKHEAAQKSPGSDLKTDSWSPPTETMFSRAGVGSTICISNRFLSEEPWIEDLPNCLQLSNLGPSL